MKKLTAVLLTAILVLALTACADSAEEKPEVTPPAEQAAVIQFDLSDTPPELVIQP